MKELKGDILLLEEGVICHQVNCLGVMGAGLAKQVKEKHPEVFESYRKVCLEYLKMTSTYYSALGQLQICTINDSLMIANIFGQGYTDVGKQTSYDAVDSALSQLQIFSRENDLNIYFPKYMGCGYGGGEWNIYLAIVTYYFPQVNVVEYEFGKDVYDPSV